MVLAGPGSGKTSVIVERTEYLIRQYGIPESSILVVTFSRAAAGEMRERFLALHEGHTSGVTFGTFHGIFYGILKQAYHLDASNIIRADRKRQFLQELALRYCPDLAEEKEFLEDLESEISMVKGNRISLEHYYSSSCGDEAFRAIYRGYADRCRRERLLDFDDMLVECYALFEKHPDILQAWQSHFRYILVDEFQDINQLQYDIIRMLASPQNHLFIVGDDDQSIYQFRGARPEIMLHFCQDYPEAETVVLPVNYRSTPSILNCAGRLIAHNQNRYEKHLSTPNAPGPDAVIRDFKNPWEEAEILSRELAYQKEKGEDLKESAILFRTNLEATFLTEKLMEYQIPYSVRGRMPNLYEHWITGNLLAYLSMAGGDLGRSHFLSVMNRPNRYISREAVSHSVVSFEELRIFYQDRSWMCDRIDEMEEHLKRLSAMSPYAGINYIRHGIGYEAYLKEYALARRMKPEELLHILDQIQESARPYRTLDAWQEHMKRYTREAEKQQRRQEQRREGVMLTTLHGCKGLEFDRVCILNVNEGIIPYAKARLDAQLEEERRLFYVGLTRSRRYLQLCYVHEQFDRKMEKSRFLEEIT